MLCRANFTTGSYDKGLRVLRGVDAFPVSLSLNVFILPYFSVPGSWYGRHRYFMDSVPVDDIRNVVMNGDVIVATVWVVVMCNASERRVLERKPWL